MATYWLTRSMRRSETVVGVAPVRGRLAPGPSARSRPCRSLCGCLALLVVFLQPFPAATPGYGAFGPPARVAVLIRQTVVPALGGPLLGVALGRWVRFPGAAFVLFLILYGWVTLTILHAGCVPGTPR